MTPSNPFKLYELRSLMVEVAGLQDAALPASVVDAVAPSACGRKVFLLDNS